MHCWRWICSHQFLVAWLGGREGWAGYKAVDVSVHNWDCHEIPGLERINQLWAKILRNIILMSSLDQGSSFKNVPVPRHHVFSHGMVHLLNTVTFSCRGLNRVCTVTSTPPSFRRIAALPLRFATWKLDVSVSCKGSARVSTCCAAKTWNPSHCLILSIVPAGVTVEAQATRTLKTFNCQACRLLLTPLGESLVPIVDQQTPTSDSTLHLTLAD